MAWAGRAQEACEAWKSDILPASLQAAGSRRNRQVASEYFFRELGVHMPDVEADASADKEIENRMMAANKKARARRIKILVRLVGGGLLTFVMGGALMNICR